MKYSTRTRLVLLSLSIALPPLALLFYIDAFGVNVIYWDEWSIISLMQKETNGNLVFSDFYEQHMEHRILFPRIAMLTIAKFTQYNIRAEMFFSWILICITMLLIFHLYWKESLRENINRKLLTFLPVSLLFFSFVQYESILWGFSCQIYMMIFAGVVSLYFLNFSKKLDIAFGLSILSAIVASFSFVTGLLIWPAAFLIILSEKESMIKKLISWSIIGCSLIIFYFYGLVRPEEEAPALTYFLKYPFESAQYFLSLLGSPLSRGILGSISFGLFILSITIILAIINHKEKSWKINRVWIALILFIGLSAIAITVGRGGFGLVLARSSRYTPIIILGIISVYILTMITSKRHPTKLKNFAAHAMLTLILVTIITSYGYGLERGQQWRYSRELGSYILTSYEIQSNKNLRKLYPDLNYLYDKIEFCEQKNLTSFAEPKINITTLTLQNSSTLSTIESINDKEISNLTTIYINLEKENTITIEGWAIDQLTGKVASDVFISIDNEFDIPTYYGLERSDVSSYLNNPNFRYSGFIATFSSSIFSKDLHSLSLKVVSNNGEFYYYPHEAYIINFK